MVSADLWQQILARPADADLKVRYLEALTQAGDWRADFVSVAVEYRRLWGDYLEAPLKPRFEELLARRRADFAQHSDAWPGTIDFILGWPIELTIAARDFARSAADIVGTIPVRHLNLRNVSDFPAVFDVPQFDQIASIDGSRQPWSDDATRALAASEHLHALRWLKLSHCGITEAQVEVLAASASLKDVPFMDLTDNPARDPVDSASGSGWDSGSGGIVRDSIFLPLFGAELEHRHGAIAWLHSLDNFVPDHPPSRYAF